MIKGVHMRVLRHGSKGNEVKILQDLLGISVDDDFKI